MLWRQWTALTWGKQPRAGSHLCRPPAVNQRCSPECGRLRDGETGLLVKFDNFTFLFSFPGRLTSFSSTSPQAMVIFIFKFLANTVQAENIKIAFKI
jgi:hypothetical protein